MHNLCKLTAYTQARSNIFMFLFVDLFYDKIKCSNNLFAKHIHISMNFKSIFQKKWLICIIYAN